jgi:hypothetical protein
MKGIMGGKWGMLLSWGMKLKEIMPRKRRRILMEVNYIC